MGEIIGECNDIVRVESVLVARRALKEGGLNCSNASSDSRMLVLLHQLRLGFMFGICILESARQPSLGPACTRTL